MEIDSKQLAAKPREIGLLDGSKVFLMTTKGGYNVVAVQKGNKSETIGIGPHPAVARHIAETRNPEIKWTQLSKSDHVPVEAFQAILPKYESMTDEVRRGQGLE